MLSGGNLGLAVATAGTLVCVLLLSGRDAWAVAGIFTGYCLFEQHRLMFLLPLMGALVWLACRLAFGLEGAGMDTRRGWAVAGIVLLGAHLALGLTGNLADVGAASVRGADAVLRGADPYTAASVQQIAGNVYGPFVYQLYVPAAALFSDPVAQRVMAILGHCLLVAALFLLGRRALGRRMGTTALVLYLAFPASAYALSIGAHDDWTAALIVLGLVVGSPLAAGALLGLAAATKVFPAALLYVWLRRRPDRRWVTLTLAGFAAAFALPLLVAMVSMGTDPGEVYRHTIHYQGTRLGIQVWNVPLWAWGSPYNFGFLWGDQVPALHMLARMGVVVLAVVVSRSAAGGTLDATRAAAAITTFLLLVLNNFSWSYISWIAPLMAVALLVKEPENRPADPLAEAGKHGQSSYTESLPGVRSLFKVGINLEAARGFRLL